MPENDQEKAKYFNLRISDETRYLLGVAAAKLGVDMTKFITEATEDRIKKVLGSTKPADEKNPTV